jgi:hypothetical protein
MSSAPSRRLLTVASHITPAGPTVAPASGPATAVSADLKAFLDAFRGLTKELVDHVAREHEQPPYVQEWIRRVCSNCCCFLLTRVYSIHSLSCSTTPFLAAK